MTEEWRDIPGHPGYQASSHGRIRSVTRQVRCRGGWRTARGKMLSTFIAKATGYTQVDISSRRHSVHRLVALAWCNGYFDGACIDHINGVRDDNRPENLEWVTMGENSRRSFANGRVSPTLGKFSADHNASKPVVATNIATGEERHFACGLDAVRQYGFDSGSISRCCHGEYAHHAGWMWRFADIDDPETATEDKPPASDAAGRAGFPHAAGAADPSTALKIECIDRLLAIAGDATLTVRERIENLNGAEENWKQVLPHELVATVVRHALKVLEGTITKADARKYLEALP